MQTIKQTETTKKLISNCLKGKADAQYSLYNMYAKAMYHTIIRMLPYATEAEDVLQEVFIKVFQNLESFQHKSTLGAWIKKICINTTLKHIRKIDHTPLFTDGEFPEYIDYVENESPLDIKRIHQKIKLLPKGSRVILNLYLFEGYQHKEIAQILNISESTSKSQYHRARTLLQKELKSLIHE